MSEKKEIGVCDVIIFTSGTYFSFLFYSHSDYLFFFISFKLSLTISWNLTFRSSNRCHLSFSRNANHCYVALSRKLLEQFDSCMGNDGDGASGSKPNGSVSRLLPSLDRLQPWMIPIAASEIIPSPIHPRKISINDRLFEIRTPRPGEMIKEAVQMAVWPALPRYG